MIKIKKNGFTLSEMLITLSVVGLLGVLVLPGLIKDTTSKASITLLQSTVSSINDAVQNEIMKTRATTIQDTNIYKSPKKFLESMDAVNIEDNTKSLFYNNEYKSLNGTKKAIGSNVTASAILKNGVGINLVTEEDNKRTLINIDINGIKEPNIIGVDLFSLILWWENDFDNNQHMGDLREKRDNSSFETLKTECNKGDDLACYYLLEASGFNHNYMKK